MSKNIKLNETEYSGVSTVQLPTTDGGVASFQDTDEVVIPTGTKTITENGTFDVTNFASALVNVATGGSDISNFDVDTGTAKPSDVHQLYIPVDTSKEVAIILTWSDEAYNANTTCGHVAFVNKYYLNGIKDTVQMSLVNDITNGLTVSLSNKAQGSGYDAEKGYCLDRASSGNDLNTSHTFNYIVFYKPVGNLSFGGE